MTNRLSIRAVQLSDAGRLAEIYSSDIKCVHYEQNNQCIGSRCPFRRVGE